MSDAGRQDFTDKASSAIKPDSQKSFGEKTKENLDKAAGTVQPDSTKSDSQKMGDRVSGSDKSDESMLDKAKNAVGLGNNNNTTH
ncbi:related to HSP12 - heat shock protein [Ustilago sp. UG-2017a]|uniref:Related to HSP12 - heat shock protein n=1 Tax=Ustilago bromivora TaxID=307758 RepID=A0A1K0FXV7_9BASI|nr:related to HSP12-heat shock protein [Ustilago bromivora]SOV08623.1 related to HSP12 - heat shock protein [Ustilago sp. UG-2017a]SYW81417.1 related to HSP12 - heat shock protein [Ustilago bromivora]